MRLFSLLLVALLASPATAAPPNPRTRAQHLRHGINASIWFAQSPRDYTVERLRTFTTEDDLALMAKLGFDHVRLSIDAAPLTAWSQSPETPVPFVTELDRVVQSITAKRMAVIIDVHPESDYKTKLLSGSEGVEHFATLWAALAQHFAATDPDLVFFELMNEPEQSDPFRWQGIEAALVNRIRAVTPHHTIIAAGAQYSGLPDLLLLQPLADPNIIYTFHDYEPFPFTHQGATWTDPRVAPLRSVPYPSTPGNVDANQAQEPTLAGKLFVADYGLNRWDAARVDATIAFAQRWSEAHAVPVYCGEFGVHRPFADPAARARWIEDMRTALEHHGIGWAMWDSQTNFGVVTKGNGTTTPDPAIVRALGLRLR